MPKRSLSDLVLDSIDTISARKNRPNLVRIYRHLHRLYDLSLATCESLIQSLLKEGRVIRVTYKGSISYRNAKTWKKYSYYMKKNMGSELPGSLITTAIAELVVQEPDYLSMGVPCNILEQHLLSMQNDNNINKEAIHKLLQRELKLESLLQLENGNYFLAPKPLEGTFLENSDFDMKFEQANKGVSKLSNNEETDIEMDFLEANNCSTATEGSSFGDIKKVEPTERSIQEDRKGLEDTGGKTMEDSNESKVTKGRTSENGNGLEITKVRTSGHSKKLKIRNHSKRTKSENCIILRIDKESTTVNHAYISDSSDGAKTSVESVNNIDKPTLVNNFNGHTLKILNGVKFVGHNLTGQLGSNVDGKQKLNSKETFSPEPTSEISSHKINHTNMENDLEMELEALTFDLNEIGELSSDIDVNKIIGVECKKNYISDKESPQSSGNTSVSTSPNKLRTLKPTSNSPSPTKVKQSDEEEEEKEEKKATPVLERVRRKKKTKYDASDYYFPSLKRKSRDSASDTDRKDEKRKKKKKKKDNAPTNLSGVFAKRVMFPGNTSMCSECKCYGSKVKSDPMVFCSTCSNEAHQSCTQKSINDKNWYCADCRQDVETCTICNKMPHEKDRGALYACSSCSNLYHKGCHNPSIKLPFSTSWHCFSCPPPEQTNDQKENSEASEKVDFNRKPKTNGATVNKKTCVEVETVGSIDKVLYFKEEPPDSTNWTSQDVYEYFRKYFDEKVARTILDQDIDGYSLKLMERSDIMKLDFKLGVCLKLLLHIKRLQLHSNNLLDIWKD